jgi:hypothetical protein
VAGSVERHRNVGVAEAFLDDPGVDALRQQQGR